MNGRSGLRRAAMLLRLSASLVLGLHPPAAAQLADTPWPMFQHDLRHTGQSAFLGPLFPTGSPAPTDVTFWPSFGKITNSPTVAADGTIYVAVDVPVPNTSGTGYLCAVQPAMTQKWCTQLRADSSQSSAAIGRDGTIYLGDRDNTLNAVDPTGSILWYYNHGYEGDIWTSPAIGDDGTIYFAPIQNLYGPGPVTALYPNGSLKWKYVIGRYIDASSPAIDQDGFIYLGDMNGGLYKVEDKGSSARLVWPWPGRVQVGTRITASPVIGSDGTIYVGSTNGLSALSPVDGHVLWNIAAGIVDQTAALGRDDTVYFAAKSGQYRVIYAVSRDGAVRWQYGPVLASSPHGGFPIVGADGIVYVGFNTGVYAFSPDGVLLWSYQTSSFVASFPAIAGTASADEGGTAVLYAVSADGKLYAIASQRHGKDTNAPPTASAGPDQSAFAGQVLEFNASASDGDADDILSFTWSFGDGKSAIGPTAHHAYVAPGVYTVTLTVSDGLSFATDTATVTVGASTGIKQVSDSFNRPDSPALDNGWQEAQGDLVIKSNELRNAPLKATHIAVQPALSGLTHTAAASFASVDNNTAPRLGIVLRFLDPLNYYALYRQMGGSSQLRISRIANGIEKVLAAAAVPQAIVNTFFRLSGDATGTKLMLKLCAATDTSSGPRCASAALTLTATDSALAGGSVGVLIGTGAGSTQQYRVDRFAGEAQ